MSAKVEFAVVSFGQELQGYTVYIGSTVRWTLVCLDPVTRLPLDFLQTGTLVQHSVSRVGPDQQPTYPPIFSHQADLDANGVAVAEWMVSDTVPAGEPVTPGHYYADFVWEDPDGNRAPLLARIMVMLKRPVTLPRSPITPLPSQDPVGVGPAGPSPAVGAGDIGKALVAVAEPDVNGWGVIPAEKDAATGSDGTGNTASATTGVANASTSLSFHETTHIGTDVAGTSLGTISDDGTTDLSGGQSMSHISSVDVVFPADWAGGNVVLSGAGCDGVAISETYVANPGSTVEGVKGFLNITGATATGGDGSHVADILIGPRIGAARKPIVTFYRVLFNGTNTATTGVNTTEGTFLPTDPKQADARYDIFYRSTHTHTVSDSGHVHAGPAHTHVQT